MRRGVEVAHAELPRGVHRRPRVVVRDLAVQVSELRAAERQLAERRLHRRTRAPAPATSDRPRPASPSTCRPASSSPARRVRRPIRRRRSAPCPRASRRRARRRSCRRRRRGRGSRGRAAASRARSRCRPTTRRRPSRCESRCAPRAASSRRPARFGNCAVACSIIASNAAGSRPVRFSSTPATSRPRQAVKSSSLPISTSTLRGELAVHGARSFEPPSAFQRLGR